MLIAGNWKMFKGPVETAEFCIELRRRAEEFTWIDIAVCPPFTSLALAVQVLASSAEAFRKAAEAHERAASMHDKKAAAGIGDVIGHERQATFHRAAATADWQRAERAQSLLSDHEPAGLLVAFDEPRDDVVP